MDILTTRIKHLPTEMLREIFSYPIPNPDNVEFHTEEPVTSYSSYHVKYDVAFLKNIKIITDMHCNKDIIDHCYLSRIAKKNGKHRYYISKIFIDSIPVYNGNIKCDALHTDYISKYIGNDLMRALFEVIYSD